MSFRERAEEAEQAIRGRHMRPLWCLPGTALGRSTWPPEMQHRAQYRWNYWWQAHLLDCLVDAQLRQPSPDREKLIQRFIRSIKIRNFGQWTNDYYDDIAWLGLALQRVGAITELDVRVPLQDILRQLDSGWTLDGGGGIWWRRNDLFKNAPANGPAAILQARVGKLDRAQETLAWMDSRLVDPETGLIWDGLRINTGELVKDIYTYCQGVFLGSCVELSTMDLADRTVRAILARCEPVGVIWGQNGGDGGLFGGILARYLALYIRKSPEVELAEQARDLLLASAEACWRGAVTAPGGPLFSPEWSEKAPELPIPEGHPARDLSVQVGAWMLLEAAATLD